MLVTLHPPAQSSGLQFKTTSRFVPNPPKPDKVDPLKAERQRRLLGLTKQVFPDGKVPDPYTTAWLSLSSDASANRLPFIQTSRIIVTNTQSQAANPPQSIFENVWCLLDTGAQKSRASSLYS